MTPKELKSAGFIALTDPYEIPREEEEFEKCKRQLERGRAGPVTYRTRWIDHEFAEIWVRPRPKTRAKEPSNLNP